MIAYSFYISINTFKLWAGVFYFTKIQFRGRNRAGRSEGDRLESRYKLHKYITIIFKRIL